MVKAKAQLPACPFGRDMDGAADADSQDLAGLNRAADGAGVGELRSAHSVVRMNVRCSSSLLTPAYLAGGFWTERDLGAPLGKETLIPVLHNVTFEDVKQYGGILPDLAGFTTSPDTREAIASKIALAVLVNDSPDELPA